MATIFIVMGVSGSGKSTVGKALANRLNCTFFDGDDFHPQENVDKMARGVPLTDTDREPWLSRLATLAADHLERDESAVVACSALKQAYREQLRVSEDVLFVYLQGNFDRIWERMTQRESHYMKANMLQSQFATLEPPTDDEAIVVSIDRSIEQIVDRVISARVSR
ncbi:MAG: gluconokinase [Anaerolineae bacterium]|nr:gluconokinase [Anaerolineae bacterium]MCO5207673.1 gluconokinase [Anaerolineae bacterium]